MNDGVIDSFARDNLPHPATWPDLLLDSPDFQYPERLNCITELVDRWVADGQGGRPCLRLDETQWSYADLADRINRIAAVLTGRFGLVPGTRVMLRAPNTPMMVATYLAVIKAGGITIATMPLLRAKELAYMLGKARVQLAVCDHRLLPDLLAARELQPGLRAVIPIGGGGEDDLCTLMAAESGEFAAYDSRADDLCLIAFTSGTTGEPKGTMHFHRDMLAICDGYARHVLRARPEDVFIGTRAAGLHLRARRGRAVPAADRRLRHPAGAGVAGRLAPGHPHAATDGLLHRAHGLPRDAHLAAAGRPRQPADLRVRRRDAAQADLARLA